jgi:hypothetical protein
LTARRPSDLADQAYGLVPVALNDDQIAELESRLGRLHARQRLGIETDHEAQVFGQGLKFFHLENLQSFHVLIGLALKMIGLYWRGLRNAKDVRVQHNYIRSAALPSAFDGYTILQLSDLHVDMSQAAMERVVTLVKEAIYDICIMTGDYRGQTFGPFEPTLAGMRLVRSAIKGPIYGVLGNHDTVRLLPGLEALGIRMLVNESATIERGNQHIHLVGVDHTSTEWTILKRPFLPFQRKNSAF